MKYVLNPLSPKDEPINFDTENIIHLALLGPYDKDAGVIYFDGVACFEPTAPAPTPAYARELEAELLAVKAERDCLLTACKAAYQAYTEHYILREELGYGDEEIGMAQVKADNLMREAIAAAKEAQS